MSGDDGQQNRRRGSFLEDLDSPKAHRERERPRHREPGPQYDTEDSYGRTRSNQQSKTHGVDSYASGGLESQEAWPADYPPSRRLDEDRFVKQTVDKILREVPSSSSAGYYEQDPHYPLPAVGTGETYDLARDTYGYPPGYDRNAHVSLPKDEYDSVPQRRIKGANRHQRLLEPPSDESSHRHRH